MLKRTSALNNKIVKHSLFIEILFILLRLEISVLRSFANYCSCVVLIYL